MGTNNLFQNECASFSVNFAGNALKTFGPRRQEGRKTGATIEKEVRIQWTSVISCTGTLTLTSRKEVRTRVSEMLKMPRESKIVSPRSHHPLCCMGSIRNNLDSFFSSFPILLLIENNHNNSNWI